VALIGEFAGPGTAPGAGPCAAPGAGPCAAPGAGPGAAPGTETVLGAGTVLDPAGCAACAAAGARFIVSPVTDPAVLAEAHRWACRISAGR